ncbi:MAG TPA: Fe-S-containing protein [Coriobacteriia bacterium]|jgi:hypothetical protein
MAKKSGNGQRRTAQSQPRQKAATPAERSGGAKTLWIVGGTIVVVLVAVLALSSGGGKGGGTAGVDPAEAKYMGRLLPKGYQEPKVASVVTYDAETAMTPVTAADAGSALSLSANDVVNDKIVSFSYARPGGRPIPLLAYVKPSGKIFVGVSFCPPCESEQQLLETDISLKCASCGTKRNAETGVGIGGACKLYPIDELPATVSNGKITIEKSVLDNWTPQPKDRKIGA